jgi:hypothetical protein
MFTIISRCAGYLFLCTTAIFPQSAVPVKRMGVIAVDDPAAHVSPTLAAHHALCTSSLSPKNAKVKYIGKRRTRTNSEGDTSHRNSPVGGKRALLAPPSPKVGQNTSGDAQKQCDKTTHPRSGFVVRAPHEQVGRPAAERARLPPGGGIIATLALCPAFRLLALLLRLPSRPGVVVVHRR